MYLAIHSPIAILAFLQSITALAVAKNSIPTSKGVAGYSGIEFTQDPKSAKVSKGLESLSLHGLHCTLDHELELQEPVASLELALIAFIKLRGWDEHWGSFAVQERAKNTRE
ncbi:hypothetical protein Tco_1519806, partial [Tanacetum coccineum]